MRNLTRVPAGSFTSGSVRSMPCGPTSKIQARIIATGKPTSRNTTMKVTVQSGNRSAGSTTDDASVTSHAMVP